MKVVEKARGILFKNASVILIMCLALFVLIRMPVFYSVENLLALGSQISVIGMASIGMSMLILTGVTDISVGAQIYLGGVVAVRVYQLTGNMVLVCIVSIIVCSMVGSVNGLVIAKLGLPSMIATLAMQQICNGAASLLIGNDSVISLGSGFKTLGQGRLFNIPVSVLIFIVLFAIGVVVMNKTVFGRYVYAIGNNADAIAASGVNVFLIREIIFIVTGVLTGFAGVINASRLGGVQFGMGVGMEFSCIAAVVVGGTSMTGGRGNILGTLMGIIVIGSIDQLLRMFNVSIYLYNVFWGMIVLFTVCMDFLRQYELRREKERRMLNRI